MTQYTLKNLVEISGVGLHSGEKSNVVLRAGEVDTGIVFVRTDLDNAEIAVHAEAVSDTQLQTVLVGETGAKVATVEHILAALCACGVDNVRIEVDGLEIPVLDGSSLPWVEEFEKAGIEAQEGVRKYLKVTEEVEVREGERMARAEPSENGEFIIDITVDYGHEQLPEMHKVFVVTADSFRHEIAPARTFILEKAIDAAKAAGLAKGGSLDNAVVYGDDGVKNDDGLRFEDEAVRHKALDCIGDLFIGGAFPIGKFTFRYPGHGINNQLIRKLVKTVEK